MKKILTIMLSSVMLLGLTACGNSGQPSKQASAAPQTNSAVKTGKTLVVYYSASGNTKRVAHTIAGASKADTFEIIPAENYSSADLNYNDSNSRVSKEHNSKERNVKLVSTSVPNWQDYDTVFVGYPIWWGIAAWPVDTFIKANDFTGKTVIPFATAASSGFGESGKLLQAMSKNGKWVAGKCFHSNNTSEIQSWMKSLGF